MNRCAVKMLWGVLAGLTILGIGDLAQADYVITLRDGKQIVVDRYREAGAQIRYRRFGGEIGIPTAQVAVIEDRETGEKRVLNPFYTAQELEAIGRQEQADAAQRQRERDRQALREPEPQRSPPKKELETEDDESTKKEPAQVRDPLCDEFGRCWSLARCMAIGEGTPYGPIAGSRSSGGIGLGAAVWNRMSDHERLRECERAEESIRWRNKAR